MEKIAAKEVKARLSLRGRFIGNTDSDLFVRKNCREFYIYVDARLTAAGFMFHFFLNMKFWTQTSHTNNLLVVYSDEFSCSLTVINLLSAHETSSLPPFESLASSLVFHCLLALTLGVFGAPRLSPVAGIWHLPHFSPIQYDMGQHSGVMSTSRALSLCAVKRGECMLFFVWGCHGSLNPVM